MTRILVVVGSLRSGSVNRRIAQAVQELAPDGIDIEVLQGAEHVPFYNEDLDVEGAVPAAAADLRRRIAGADALLVVTAEHNGSIPAVLKNVIDWGSRPHLDSPLAGKPAAVIGTAFGQYGGVWAQDETRKSLGVAGAEVVDEVRLALPHSTTRFAERHPREDDEVVGAIHDVLASLVRAAERRTVPAANA